MAIHDSQIEARPRAGEREAAKGSRPKLTLSGSDIRELYETARALAAMGGAPFLNRLFDAEAALSTGHLARVHQILAQTRAEFEKSHLRLLRFRPSEGGDRKKAREEARLAAKKQQVEQVLAAFNAYLAVAERMAKVQEAAPPPAAPTEPSPTPPSDRGELPAGFKQAFEEASTTDAQFAVASQYFTCAAVESAEMLVPGGLYFLRTRSTGHLLRITAGAIAEAVQMTDVLRAQAVRPQPVEALVEQGRKDKFFALTPRDAEADAEARAAATADDAAPADPLEAQNPLLDRQLFNVLMMAVKQSGLDISTDLIVQVRDNEFRKGEYHDAFEKLNQLATRFEAAAVRRKEDLRQHDQWLNSGQSGLSMREVEVAKLRNANERTRLEHAVHRFGLVVEPLRILSRESV